MATSSAMLDRNAAPPSTFELHVTGQVESGSFAGDDNLYCNILVHHGIDWQVVAGMEEGVTQVASISPGSDSRVVWNFPLELTFKSTNVYGWPQIVLTVHGTDFLNRDVIRGYGSVHIPVVPGAHEVEVPMFRPLSVGRLPRAMAQMLTCLPQSSLLQQFIGWIHATPAGSARDVLHSCPSYVTAVVVEYIDPKRPALPTGREVTRVRTSGTVVLKLNVVVRNMKQLGYSIPVSSNLKVYQ
ncbi:hypothetical protein GUITHDRAFT_108112 [Guillardia theta CCMP2712]|uniref:B9 domain-containing protein 1 n=1 Tax=Guillardia theta (strain CCMP2712) TaxID=905079 RepID=L1JC27_GUITC|nr:hypothetical protein GUITHDRAFT_108112 [Guillardia theta CCMP2712]EKX46076.1 hypothetical protein GUITHDRAFT_108112 [Guillardia theta CCMP2712]|eukprot:XP_005833056.1 hypothetical protein GUITHDRAFT_108112 [Guillardia theta CCMP2712]